MSYIELGMMEVKWQIRKQDYSREDYIFSDYSTFLIS